MTARRVENMTNSLREAEVVLGELDHLGHCLRRENGQEICDEQVPVLGLSASARLHAAESDALALVGAPAASVNERRVEPVHVEVLVVDEEALAHCRVAVVEGADVEFDLFRQQGALVGSDYFTLVCEDGAALPVLLLLKLLEQVRRVQTRLYHFN